MGPSPLQGGERAAGGPELRVPGASLHAAGGGAASGRGVEGSASGRGLHGPGVAPRVRGEPTADFPPHFVTFFQGA